MGLRVFGVENLCIMLHYKYFNNCNKLFFRIIVSFPLLRSLFLIIPLVHLKENIIILYFTLYCNTAKTWENIALLGFGRKDIIHRLYIMLW